ncbi:hypothetical protein KCP74_10890 [Salmonella enterica subsp. enterica]|nr:hypothetical protein KCP74_10890 [Salmonella enterica subsp. enterica]
MLSLTITPARHSYGHSATKVNIISTTIMADPGDTRAAHGRKQRRIIRQTPHGVIIVKSATKRYQRRRAPILTKPVLEIAAWA